MAENTRSGKKDPTTAREIVDDLEELPTPGGTKPRVENPNRDRARGDWDRSGQLDEGGVEPPQS